MPEVANKREETRNYAWRLFQIEILENQLIKRAIVNCLVFNPVNRIEVLNFFILFFVFKAQTFSSDENALDYKERSFRVNFSLLIVKNI